MTFFRAYCDECFQGTGMKRFDVCGVGNAIVDVLLDLKDDEFNRLGLERGSYGMVDTDFQLSLLKQFDSRSPHLASGGSVANSIIALAQLGARSAFVCCLGDDRYGLHFTAEFEQRGIEIGVPL